MGSCMLSFCREFCFDFRRILFFAFVHCLFFVNWLQCLSIVNMLVMHLIRENSQISTSSRFRNSSGYVFFKICSHIFMIFEVKLE